MKEILTWGCHVDDNFAEGCNDRILGKDLITALGLSLKISEQFIGVGNVPYIYCTAPMVDICTCEYKLLGLKGHVQREE